MPKPDDNAVATTGGAYRFGRHRWLLLVVLVVTGLAAAGWTASGTDGSGNTGATSSGSSTAQRATSQQAAQGAVVAELGVTRDGHDVILSGSVPDRIAKSTLDSAVKAQWISANIIDHLTVADGVALPDLSAISGVFSAADSIPDFGLTLAGDTLTLVGTAPTLDIASQVQEASALAFPNIKLANNIQIPAPGGPAVPSAPGGPSPTSAPAPAATPCASLQTEITGLLRTPISFITGGAQLTTDSRQVLARVAEKISACPAVAVSVVGYTDNVGGDAVNLSLSASRAKAVAALLVSDGVPIGRVTSRGAGSANPVAGNDTAEGRAQNRRVEITAR